MTYEEYTTSSHDYEHDYNEPQMGKSTIEALWQEFGNCCIDDNDRIDSPWCGWEAGTDRFEIWHWFDAQYAQWGGVHALAYPGERVDNSRCPVCGSWKVEGDEINIFPNGASQCCYCHNCGSDWIDVYRFETCEEIYVSEAWKAHEKRMKEESPRWKEAWND